MTTWTSKFNVCRKVSDYKTSSPPSSTCAHNDDPADRRLSQQLRVAQQGSCRVVVHMQESQRLLLEDEEHRVNQLPKLQGKGAGDPFSPTYKRGTPIARFLRTLNM